MPSSSSEPINSVCLNVELRVAHSLLVVKGTSKERHFFYGAVAGSLHPEPLLRSGSMRFDVEIGFHPPVASLFHFGELGGLSAINFNRY